MKCRHCGGDLREDRYGSHCTRCGKGQGPMRPICDYCGAPAVRGFGLFAEEINVCWEHSRQGFEEMYGVTWEQYEKQGHKGLPDGVCFNIVPDHDPGARKFMAALGEMVADHITGRGVERSSTIVGGTCTICGRAKIVVTEIDGKWYHGCAYAIGGGLCTSYQEVSEADAQKIIQEAGGQGDAVHPDPDPDPPPEEP